MTKLILIFLIICSISYIIYRNLPVFFLIKANKKYSENNIKEAMLLYEKAYKFNHNKPTIKIMYSYVLLMNGDVDKAEGILNEASKGKLLSKDEINAALNHSLVMWKKGNLDKAIELLEQIMNKGYKNSIIYQNLGYYLILKGDYSKALEFNKEAYEYNSENAGLLDNLAMNYYFLGDYHKAEEIYDKLIPLNPSFATAYYYYAKTLINEKNYEKSIEMLHKALNCRFSYISVLQKKDIEFELEAVNKLIKE